MSVRDDGQRMQLGNRISAMLVPLPVGEPDARVRLDAVRAHAPPTSRNAGRRSARPRCSACPSTRRPRCSGSPRAPRTRNAFANLIVTNIPGPQVPLYCLGARMFEVYPIVPLSRNLTLNVAILSYCGQLHFGLIGDGASGRDLERARRRDRGRVRRAAARSRAASSLRRSSVEVERDAHESPTIPTAEVTDLLQLLIRNQCVNDGTVASGEETRSVDLLAGYLAGAGDHEIYEPQPGRQSLVAQHRGHRSRRARRCCSWATPTSCR